MFLPRAISVRWISTSAALAPAVKPLLVVGLGNPGDKYKFTRHNVGFDMIDVFARALGVSMDTVHFKALFGQGLVGEVPVLLAKPQTYMNLSGESLLKLAMIKGIILLGEVFALVPVICPLHLAQEKEPIVGLLDIDAGPLAAYYKLPLDRIVLIFDDMELPCGVLRLQPRGGHGGHKGVINVIQHFRGNRDFARLRIGIGKPPGQMDPKAYVLQKFNASARVQIDASLQEGVGILKTVITKGLTESASSVNTEQKYKHLRLQASIT